MTLHINDRQETRPCSARIRACKFAESTNPHFDTPAQEARWRTAMNPMEGLSKKSAEQLAHPSGQKPWSHEEDIAPRMFRWTSLPREGFDTPQEAWTLRIDDMQGNLVELSRFHDEDAWTVVEIIKSGNSDYDEEFFLHSQDPGARGAGTFQLRDAHPQLQEIEKQLGQKPSDVVVSYDEPFDLESFEEEDWVGYSYEKQQDAQFDQEMREQIRDEQYRMAIEDLKEFS